MHAPRALSPETTFRRKHQEMSASVLRLSLLAVALSANARARSSGELRPIIGKPPCPSSRLRKKRHQVVNAIFASGVVGFDPVFDPRWTCVRAPRSQDCPKKTRKYVWEYNIESSLHPGTYSRVRVQYSDREDRAQAKQLFKPIRDAAWNLTECNRHVRVNDGGVGWMVGAGHHLSYAGFIEFFKPEQSGVLPQARSASGVRPPACGPGGNPFSVATCS